MAYPPFPVAIYTTGYAYAKTQFSKLGKIYSSNVVSLIRPVEAASLQYASLLNN